MILGSWVNRSFEKWFRVNSSFPLSFSLLSLFLSLSLPLPSFHSLTKDDDFDHVDCNLDQTTSKLIGHPVNEKEREEKEKNPEIGDTHNTCLTSSVASLDLLSR